jgi:hypothetical protein
MEKRAFKRIPLQIQIKFFSGKTEYLGTATNLSEKGMLISAEVNFPLQKNLEIIIKYKENLFSIPAKITSFKRTGDVYNGIGVKLINPPQEYLEFVDSLKSSL